MGDGDEARDVHPDKEHGDPEAAAQDFHVAWEALLRVVGSVPKEVLPLYMKLVRDAVSTARDKERRKKKGGPVLIPGFCLPKALQPVLPIFSRFKRRSP